MNNRLNDSETVATIYKMGKVDACEQASKVSIILRNEVQRWRDVSMSRDPWGQRDALEQARIDTDTSNALYSPICKPNIDASVSEAVALVYNLGWQDAYKDCEKIIEILRNEIYRWRRASSNEGNDPNGAKYLLLQLARASTDAANALKPI